VISALVALLFLSGVQASESEKAALEAYREGRFEDAVRMLEKQDAPSYEDLLTLGLAQGRLDRLGEAAQTFDRAIAADPGRPEAWVERGGVRFLESRYDTAIRDLQTALRRRDDPYVRGLLASSLHLAGRTDEALASWNAIGEPRLRRVSLLGLSHTRDAVARRELSLLEGEVLDLPRLRESRRRMGEVGVFERVTLRPVPRGSGEADLEIALVEQHGLADSVVELAVGTGLNLLYERVRLRYANVGGSGLSISGQVRWDENRPEVALGFDVPRPFGIPAYLHVQGFRGRQAYEAGDPVVRRSRGLDLGLRHVFGASTTGSLGVRVRDRTFSVPRDDAEPGVILGVEGGVERTLVEARRGRLDSAVRLFQTMPGSDLVFTRAVVTVTGKLHLSTPDGSAVEPSLLASRVLWGSGSNGTPLDEMFAPGASPDMELPLRAHRQTTRGVLGATPLGQKVVLANVEWRRRLVDRPQAQFGIVLLYDGARIASRPDGPARTLHDAGVGIRIGFRGAPVLRIDVAHGLSDGKNALFVGLGEVF
jgi:hypothetical protein